MPGVEHHPTFPIAHHPGCEGAGLQAVRTADAPLSAFLSAYAAFYRDKTSIRGTLAGDPDDTREWIREQLAHFQIPLGRAGQWARAINLERAEFTDAELMRPIDGLTPFPHQVLACRMATVGGLGAALGCGLGKTALTSNLLRAVTRRKYANRSRCWIFCPLNAFGAWARFLPTLEAEFQEVRVLSVDSAHLYVGLDRSLGGVVVFDEAHQQGCRDARRTKASHKIREAFDFGICLTGTLTHAGIENCLSIQDLIVPGMALFANRWKAGDYFKCLVKKQLSATHSVTALVTPTGVALQRFHEWLGRSIISLTLDSPEVVSSIRVPPQEKHDVPLCEPWPDLTDEVVRLAEEILAAEGELPHMQRIVHLLCQQGIAEKLDWLLGQIDGPEVSVVVFAHYRASLDAAAARLDAQGISYVRVDGDVDQTDRPELQRRFQSGEVQVFLGQTKAAGVAIDLYRAQVSVMLDHSWKAIDYAQALARTRRIGQEFVCHHFDIYANSFQKKIIDRVRGAADFDASVSEFQSAKRALAMLVASPPEDPSYG